MATFMNLSKYFLIACVLMNAVIANGSDVVIYWGQESQGAEQSLAAYCSTGNYDIIVIGFAYLFPTAPNSPYPGLNFAGHCEDAPDPSNPYLLNCPSIGANITYCQSQGVKIFLSFGGGVGVYGFSSDDQASTFATTVWNMFLGGSGDIRPFGNAILDGVDLDIEGGAITGYITFINALRQYFASSGRNYYISSAPQCPYPDGRLGPGAGTALQSAWFDYVWVQFYNNYCGINVFPTSTYNFNVWANWARTISVNPNVKVLVGAPAGPRAAGSGYVPASTLQTIHADHLLNYGDVYGGIMLWDTSNSDINNNFGGQVASFVHSGASNTPAPVVSTPVAPSTTGPVTAASTSGMASTPVVSTPVAPSTTGAKHAASTSGRHSSTSSGKQSTTGMASTPVAPSTTGSQSTPAACTNGNMKCLTNATYSICSNGAWGTSQSCQTGLSCVSCGSNVMCGYTPGSSSINSAPVPTNPVTIPTTPSTVPTTPSNPTPSSTTCTIGQQQCLTQSTYQTCAPLSDGTTYWAAAQSCQTGLSCHANGDNIYCY